MTTHLVSPASDPLAQPRFDHADIARTTRKVSLVGGGAIMLVAALAGFGNIVVVQGLVTPGDASSTARAIVGSEGLFRLGVACLYLAALLDIVVAWSLMRIFSPVNAEVSRLGAWLRLAYAGIFMVALSQLAGVPGLLSDADHSSSFTRDQVQLQAMAKIDTFHDIWCAGLVLFGAHLAAVGVLAHRSGFVPRPIGVLLVVAGAGYAFDSFVSLFDQHPAFAVSSVTFVGEFLLGLWLLLRSRRVSESMPGPVGNQGDSAP